MLTFTRLFREQGEWEGQKEMGNGKIGKNWQKCGYYNFFTFISPWGGNGNSGRGEDLFPFKPDF